MLSRQLPRMAAALVPRELASWSLNAVALGALEGGLLGVIVKNHFSGAADPVMVNFAVAIVAGAPSFTNLSSFLFAALTAGRDKLVLLSRMMQVIGACLLLMAVPVKGAAGLALFALMAVVARTAWSGILTVRASVWRVNYPREWRGQVTARLVQMSSLLVAGCAALIGFLMDWRPGAFRPAFALAAVASLIAAHLYRGARVRRHRQLLAAERHEHLRQGGRMRLAALLSILRTDRDFRGYMNSMMIFGSGNLMTIPLLVVLLNEQLELRQRDQVLITSSLPLLVMFFSIPFWARLLDQGHIFSYRIRHSWTFVASTGIFALAVMLREPALLWPASVVMGAAYAGGHLGWNLGHNDFSSDANASQYMAIHVTLTGLRGLFVPIVAVGFYQWLLAHHPQHAASAMLLPVALTLLGALSFIVLHRDHRRRQPGGAEIGDQAPRGD